MSNHDDEMSAMGSLERETRRDQHLEREARLNPDAAVGDPFEEQEPVTDIGENPFREGQDVRFELAADHPLRAAAAARNCWEVTIPRRSLSMFHMCREFGEG